MTQHRPPRDEQLKSKKMQELKQENAQLKRQNARLRKALEKAQGVEPAEDEEEGVEALDTKKATFTCEKCGSEDLRAFRTPTKTIVCCGSCLTRRAMA
jgi:regulator of replication initiation timing